MAEHMEYARERARWHSRKHPSLAEDIMATAYLALVEAVDLKPENLKAVISRRIENAVAELVSRNDLIYVPRRQKRRLIEAKKNLDSLPKAILYPEPTELWDLRRSKEHPTWVMMHLEDVMDLLDLSPYEKQILKLRMDDFSVIEIAGRLDRKRQTIYHALERISERYHRLVKRYPEILKPNDEA